jgi:hypothetical protein
MKLLFLCVYMLSLLSIAPSLSAQTGKPFTIDTFIVSGFSDVLPLRIIEADKPTPLTFTGNWPFTCGPLPAGHEIDTVKKIVLIKFKEVAAPCPSPPNKWDYALPSTSFPFGRYDIIARVDAAIVNGASTGTYFRAARGYFFSAISAPATIANQRLIANPGVADAEQFLEVTTLLFCGGSKPSVDVIRSGSALEVRVNYLRETAICPLLAPPTTAVSTLLSLGKLPAGSYDVKVINTFTDTSGALIPGTQITTLQERLTINARSVAANTSLNGVWYDPNEPGWGMTITENNNTAFVTWYAYIANQSNNTGVGVPFWYVMTGKRDGAIIRGGINWPRTGTDFRLKWDASDYVLYNWGEAIITMIDSDTASVTTNFGLIFNDNLPLRLQYASVVTRNVSRLKF